MQSHMQTVTTQESMKVAKENVIQQKHQKDREAAIDNQLAEQEKQRKFNLTSMNQANKGMISYHEVQKQNEREAQEARVNERKAHEESLKKTEEEEKNANLLKQQIYRDTLKYQTEINHDDLAAIHPSLRSTKLQVDVTDDQVRKNAVNAMVPGIHNLNSVGSMPTLRKAFKPKQGFSPSKESNKFTNDPLLAASKREIQQAATREPQTS